MSPNSNKMIGIIILLTASRIHKKRNRALWILNNYNKVTPRNGKYNKIMLKEKQYFESEFFNL